MAHHDKPAEEMVMGAYKFLINGRMEDGDSKMNVLSPATEEVLSVCPRASKAQLDKAVTQLQVINIAR